MGIELPPHRRWGRSARSDKILDPLTRVKHDFLTDPQIWVCAIPENCNEIFHLHNVGFSGDAVGRSASAAVQWSDADVGYTIGPCSSPELL